MARDYLKITYQRKQPSAVRFEKADEITYVNVARLKEELGKIEQFQAIAQDEDGISQFSCYRRLDVLAALDCLTQDPRGIP